MGLTEFFVLFLFTVNFVSSQTPTVTLCPLYLALQNRCPTQSTTVATSTLRTTPMPENGNDTSGESEAEDMSCPNTITFCPEMQLFVSGDRNCTSGPTIQIRLTTLGRLLANPSSDGAGRVVGDNNVDALGNTFESISKTIQATPTQATIGVTFIPAGELIGIGG